MNAMMFAYVQARQSEIAAAAEQRRLVEVPSMRDRLGRTLIAWGEQLVTVPASSPGVSMRSAA
jgi:hypothetical protein